MPGGDGSGPLGLGPGTGRAAGCCGGYAAPAERQPFLRGRCGWGLGIPASQFYPRAVPDEKAVLKHREKFIQEQLERIEKRLEEINGQEEG